MTDASHYYRNTFFAFLLLFSFMHYYDLGKRPLHHDEGVNGNFMRKLVVDNDYSYDPENYHGPSLYYFQLIPTWIYAVAEGGLPHFNIHSMVGLTPLSLRLGVAFIGLIVLIGVFFTAPMIGRWGAMAAFVLAGFSCDLLFFSRYFIHETYVILFTLGIYLSVVYYNRGKNPVFFYLGVASAAFLFCTKETSVVIFGTLLLATLLTEAVHWLLHEKKLAYPYRMLWNRAVTIFHELKIHIPLAISIALVIWFVLFTSFFKNMRGPWDSFRTYIYWTREGVESGHVKPFPYYISEILIRYELPLVILSYVGMAAALLRNDKKGIYLLFWTLGTIGFYSLTPYKTPWLVINLVLPMCLMAGYGFQAMLDWVKTEPLALRRKAGNVIVFVFALAPFLYQLPTALKVVYREYDAEKHPQVYAHTSRSVFALLNEVDKLTREPYGDKNLSINVFTEKYWPLPFYFRYYPFVHYFGTLDDIRTADADLIIVDQAKRDQMAGLIKESYTQKQFSLRPGVPLSLYTNNRILQRANIAIPSLLTSTVMSSPPEPGLRKETFSTVDFSGKPKVTPADISFEFRYGNEDPKPYPTPFSIRWTGYIEIKNPGQHKFSLESDDGSWLYIDGKEIVDNGGEHANTRTSGKANLSVGFHKVEIKYFDIGGEAILRLYWAQPGAPEAVITKSIFFSPRHGGGSVE